MQQKKFANPQRENRPIEIRFDGKFFTFHFPTEDGRQFYELTMTEVHNDPKYWLDHMNRKSWFTEDMEEWIKELSK